MELIKKPPTILIIIFILGLIISGGVLGYKIGTKQIKIEKEQECEYQRQNDGFFFKGYTENQTRNYLQLQEGYGDWICVNIREMSYGRAIEVCQHETGHKMFNDICKENISKCDEFFAEICEKDMEKCLEALEIGEIKN